MAAINNDWLDALKEEFKKPYYKKLFETVNEEYRTRQIFPPADDIFNAFHLTPLHNVKAVILGQDPLSPSTRKKDMGLKLKKYISARVREYWMIDPDKKKVVVYDLEHNELPVIYGFEDQVPVQIFDGKCQIDFSEIYSYIEFLFEKE